LNPIATVDGNGCNPGMRELLAAGKAAGMVLNKDQIKRAENEISAQNNK